MEDNHLYFVQVPANRTDRLQPLDISVNKAAKDYLRKEFQSWYADKICSQLKGGSQRNSVDLRLSVVKPLSAKWMMNMFNYIKARPEIIVGGFRNSGIFSVMM